MKKKYVFDAGVISLYFAGREDVKTFFNKIFKGTAEGYICEVNLAEYYYKAIRKIGREAAEIRFLSIRSKINVVSPEMELTREAAKIKAKYEKLISLADAYAIALTKKVKGILLTTDSKIRDLKEVETILIKI